MEKVKYESEVYGLVGFIAMTWTMTDIGLDATSVGRFQDGKY
jgi:hypothetical protein